MIAVISPSKDLDFKSEVIITSNDIPRLHEQSKQILEVIKKKKTGALMKLMDISKKLAQQNVDRYQVFSDEFNDTNSRPAIFAFSGDVYRGLNAKSLNINQLNYCQSHVRILSGLYGVIRPFDLIQPYRLEMGIPIKINKHKNLYSFWGNQLAELLQDDMETNHGPLINLASNEYFAAVKTERTKEKIIHIHFREYKNNALSFVSFTAKKARGLMIRYMALENLESEHGLKNFDLENYQFESKLSTDDEWYFVR